MPAKSYSYLAPVYNHMMRFIDYRTWSKYIVDISKTAGKKKLTALELACGSGKLANRLKNKFGCYVISDLSLSMLKETPSKIKNKVCCSLSEPSFKQEFDFVFSTFDSVNYLLTKKNFIAMLENVAGVLKENGVFTFDVSLEKNSLKHQKYLNREGEINGIKYRQKSRYSFRTRIHSNWFKIVLASGEKVKEIHRQKIYRFDEYFKMIDRSPFYVHECFNTFSFINATDGSERAQFILKKRINHALI